MKQSSLRGEDLRISAVPVVSQDVKLLVVRVLFSNCWLSCWIRRCRCDDSPQSCASEAAWVFAKRKTWVHVAKLCQACALFTTSAASGHCSCACDETSLHSSALRGRSARSGIPLPTRLRLERLAEASSTVHYRSMRIAYFYSRSRHWASLVTSRPASGKEGGGLGVVPLVSDFREEQLCHRR